MNKLFLATVLLVSFSGVQASEGGKTSPFYQEYDKEYDENDSIYYDDEAERKAQEYLRCAGLAEKSGYNTVFALQSPSKNKPARK